MGEEFPNCEQYREMSIVLCWLPDGVIDVEHSKVDYKLGVLPASVRQGWFNIGNAWTAVAKGSTRSGPGQQVRVGVYTLL